MIRGIGSGAFLAVDQWNFGLVQSLREVSQLLKFSPASDITIFAGLEVHPIMRKADGTNAFCETYWVPQFYEGDVKVEGQ